MKRISVLSLCLTIGAIGCSGSSKNKTITAQDLDKRLQKVEAAKKLAKGSGFTGAYELTVQSSKLVLGEDEKSATNDVVSKGHTVLLDCKNEKTGTLDCAYDGVAVTGWIEKDGKFTVAADSGVVEATNGESYSGQFFLGGQFTSEGGTAESFVLASKGSDDDTKMQKLSLAYVIGKKGVITSNGDPRNSGPKSAMAMTVLASGHEGDIQSEFHNLSIRTLSDRTVLTAQGVGNQRISVSIDDRDQVLLHTRTGISDCGSAEIVEDTKSGMATLTASCDDSGQTEIAATVPATIL